MTKKERTLTLRRWNQLPTIGLHRTPAAGSDCNLPGTHRVARGMTKRLKLAWMIVVVAGTACGAGAAQTASISTDMRDLLRSAAAASDYPTVRAAFAKLDEMSPAGTETLLSERFSL